MSPTDSVFLTVESARLPMHVAGLELFSPPAGAGPDWVTDLVGQLTADEQVAPLFARRPVRSVATLGQWAWQRDDQFDLGHHVRHNALPRPGRILELLALCSRLHGTMLDRHRPLWEAHLIEGLADGRFAVYFKVHHALLDGLAAQRALQQALSSDPDQRNLPPPWATQPGRPKPPRPQPAESAAVQLEVAQAAAANGPSRLDPGAAARSAVNLVSELTGVATQAAAMPEILAGSVRRALRHQTSALSFDAPKTIFNVPISSSRRFAAQAWPIQRLRRVGKAAGATVNDVVLAMCSGALRAYLSDLQALPDQSLVALVPIALRTRDKQRAGGNAVGSVMCSLATDEADPGRRLERIKASMAEGKQALASMTPLQIQAMTAIGMSPLLLQAVPGLHNLARPPFNLIISNVPGPRSPLYLEGARLDGAFPLSIPWDGQALNITCTSYTSEIAFGLTGCRRTVPHLQRLLGHLEDSLGALEVAIAA